jgi:hypothetical protein
MNFNFSAEDWDRLGDTEYLEKLINENPHKPKPTPKVVPKEPKVDLQQIKMYIEDSVSVIAQSKISMEKHQKAERYFAANEMRLQIKFHTKNVEYLTKILEGKKPFVYGQQL